MFANFVDDMLMEITHIFRGEDHLSNTAGPAALYIAFNKTLPFYWHMPIICNTQGQKLSKRDFGFSLKDLQLAGYLPEAICNYLTIIGSSFEEEIMPMQMLIEKAKLDHPTTAGLVKYDVHKLTWLNRKWISCYDPEKLASLCTEFIEAEYPAAQALSPEKLSYFLQQIKSDMSTLKDSVTALAFYFKRPELTSADIEACIAQDKHAAIISAVSDNLGHLENAHDFVERAKKEAAKLNLDTKNLFWFLRLALIGSTKGPAIHLLIEMLGAQESFTRIKTGLETLTSA
jgi:glutamyl/glutaminyl-tRNA synthetase